MGANQSHSWCIVIPAFNEEETLARVVKRTAAVLDEIAREFSIIIIDDGSVDRTGAIAEDLHRQDARVHVVHHDRNRGIGEAVSTGYARAEADVIGMICADGQFDPEDLRRFVPFIDEYDVIASYRQNRQDSVYRMVVSLMDRLLIHTLFDLSLRDINWVKLYKRWVVKEIELESTSPFLETEIVVKAARRGAKITEFPAPYYPRIAGRAKGASLFHVYRTLVDLFALYRKLRAYPKADISKRLYGRIPSE